MEKAAPNKKLLENTFLSGLVVPIAIVLVGALIIFGVTKMLSTERTYRDLVQDLHSKTFGNRGVAAFELSKLINANKIPKEEYPWLVENLTNIYVSAKDSKARSFVVVALGALRDPMTINILEQALNDGDAEVEFQAVAALGKLPKGSFSESSKVLEKLEKTKDLGIKQGLIFVMATHELNNSEKLISKLVDDSDITVRFAAATALIKYKNEKAIPVIEEIMFSDYSKIPRFNEKDQYNLKLNVLRSLNVNKWNQIVNLISRFLAVEVNKKLKVIAQQVLIFQKS